MTSKRKGRRAFEKNVVIYLRYSTKNQTDLSIEYQQEHADKYCSEQGYTIVRYFIDEARTATNDNRDSFQQMIKEAQEEPPWSKIIVFSFNRFARNTDYDGYYKIVLLKKGITIESATEDNSNTPEARLARNITASYDAYMPERCAVHTHASLETKARKCLHCGGTPPLGYDIKDNKLVINKDEAETVKLIFEMYDRNYSYNDMIKVLNEQGRTTKNGSSFKKTSFNSILQQEKYKGYYVWNKRANKKFDNSHNNHAYKSLEEQVRIAGGCEAIIDESLFDRIQEKMKSNRRRNTRSSGKYHYMLSGMGKVYCAECGAMMVGASNKSHNKRYRYYTCPNHKHNGCITKDLRASYIEHLVSTIIVNKVLTYKNFNEYNNLIKEIFSHKSHTSLKKELSGVIKAIDNILKVIETNPTEEAAERLSALSRKKEDIQMKISEANNVPQMSTDNLHDIRFDIHKELEESSDPLVYDILDKFLERITVSNDNVEIEFTI